MRIASSVPYRANYIVTTAPISVAHQVYPYQSAKNGCKDGATGIGGAADCNCFLWLEMVEGGGKEPQDKRLTRSGNFATQASVGHTPVVGTYLLSHALFLGDFLLPELRALNRATIIYHEPLDFNIDPKDQKSGAECNFVVGQDPGQHADDDPVFDFKAQYDPQNPRQVTSYKFRWTDTKNCAPKEQKSEKSNCWGTSHVEGI
jgi:hypothetical protein